MNAAEDQKTDYRKEYRKSAASRRNERLFLTAGILLHVSRKGATIRAPIMSPIHHAWKVAERAGSATIPCAHKLAKPIEALTSVLIPAARTINSVTSLMRGRDFLNPNMLSR